MSFNTNETVESLSEHEKVEMQMKFINKYKEIFYLMEKCKIINHTDLIFFANISERTARRFTNEYLDRRIVKINNKITTLNKNNKLYSKASANDEIYKELIEKLPRKKATLLRLKNKSFYMLNSDNREIQVSNNKIDNALCRAIEYKLRKESDIEETIRLKKVLNKAIRETKNERDKNEKILDEDNRILDEKAAFYNLIQHDLLKQGYNPNEFFSRFIFKKIEMTNSTVTIHLNYVFKERSDIRIARDIEVVIATIELLKYRSKKMQKRNIEVNLQIYSTTCLNVAQIEKTIEQSNRTMNCNYYYIEDQVLSGVENKLKQKDKMYLFYTKLFNKENKYFIYDEMDKCFKLYY